MSPARSSLSNQTLLTFNVKDIRLRSIHSFHTASKSKSTAQTNKDSLKWTQSHPGLEAEHTLERTTKVHLVSPLRQAFGVNEKSCMAAEKTVQAALQLDLALEEAERKKIMSDCYQCQIMISSLL
eukprot:scaffold5698_cov72-Skeletonema_dohrnii-CCMP3373.AAC.2